MFNERRQPFRPIENTDEGANNEVNERKLRNDHYGYNTVEERGGEIVCLKGDDKPALHKNMEVEVIGDTRGYAGGLTAGEHATIVKFEDPDKDTAPILVRTKNNELAHLKIREINPINLPEDKE